MQFNPELLKAMLSEVEKPPAVARRKSMAKRPTGGS